MKKIVLTLIGVFTMLTLIAQPPKKFQRQRQLPNQFRGFVDHQQGTSFQKPEIKKENGKIIITMSESQFDKMKEMRMIQRNSMRHASFRFQHCDKCENSHKKHMKNRLHRGKRKF